MNQNTIVTLPGGGFHNSSPLDIRPTRIWYDDDSGLYWGEISYQTSRRICNHFCGVNECRCSSYPRIEEVGHNKWRVEIPTPEEDDPNKLPAWIREEVAKDYDERLVTIRFKAKVSPTLSTSLIDCALASSLEELDLWWADIRDVVSTIEKPRSDDI